MFAIAVWIACSAAVAGIAKACGRSGVAWLLFSIILSPSLCLILVALLADTPS